MPGGSRSRSARPSKKPPGNKGFLSRPADFGREHRELTLPSYPGSPRARDSGCLRSPPHCVRDVGVGSADAVLVRRGGLRRVRARVGSRRRDEPVRRVRPGARGADLRPDPRALLHGHRDRESRPQGGARPPGRGPARGQRVLDGSVRRHGCRRRNVSAAQGRRSPSTASSSSRRRRCRGWREPSGRS